MDWWENSLSTAPQNINVILADESYDGVKYMFQFGQVYWSIWTNMFDNQTNTLREGLRCAAPQNIDVILADESYDSVKKKKHFLVWTNKFVNLDTNTAPENM